MNHLIDLMIIHQGIINSNNTMFPQIIIIAFLGPDVMSIPKALEKIVKDIGTRGDDDVDQLHFNHITDHLAHPTWDHCARQPDEDNTSRIAEHFSENFKTFEDIAALKRGMLEGSDQIEKVIRPFEI
jgi:hypothetical protein